MGDQKNFWSTYKSRNIFIKSRAILSPTSDKDDDNVGSPYFNGATDVIYVALIKERTFSPFFFNDVIRKQLEIVRQFPIAFAKKFSYLTVRLRSHSTIGMQGRLFQPLGMYPSTYPKNSFKFLGMYFEYMCFYNLRSKYDYD